MTVIGGTGKLYIFLDIFGMKVFFIFWVYFILEGLFQAFGIVLSLWRGWENWVGHVIVVEAPDELGLEIHKVSLY